MTTMRLHRSALAVALVLLTSVTAFAEEKPDPHATLKRMAAALEQASSLSVQAWTAYDVVQPDGQKLQFHGSTDVQMTRPGRLHARARKEGTDRELWLREGQINVLDVKAGTWSRIEGPATTDGMFDLLAKTYGFSMPLADLLYSNVDDELMGSALSSADVGTVDVAGVICRHLAFRSTKVDWQIWIEEGERALPRKVVINYKNEPGQPQYSALLWDWNLGPRLPASLFDFVPPPGAKQVTMNPVVAPAATATGKGR